MSDQEIKIRLTAEGAQQAGAAFQKAAQDLRRVGESSGYTRQQLQQVQFQITDIASGLATGQSPFTVLLQQGGQLKDAFGSVGGAVRALGVGIASAITPANLALAAVAGLGIAFIKGADQAGEMRRALLLTGNAAGLTADGFDQLGRRTAAAAGTTLGAAREITQGLVATGQVGGSALAVVAQAAARLQQVTGQSSEQIVGDFAGMSDGVAAWASAHNKAWHFVSSAQLDYIRQLEQAGDTQGAMIAAGQALIAHLGDQRSQLGLLEQAWLSVKQVASAAWDQMLAVGRPDTDLDKVAKAAERLRAIRNGTLGTGYLSQWVYGSESDAEAGLQTANRDALRNFDAAKASAAIARETDAREQLSQITARLNGSNSQYVRDLERIQALSKELGLSEKERVTLLTQLALANGPAAKGLDDQRRQADEQYRKMVRDTLANRAPRLADIEAQGYEAANRAAEENTAKAAEELRRRQQQVADFGFQLQEQTAQINASLIADDEARGLAQIEIERQAMQRRLDVLAQGGTDITEAQQALNDNVVAQQRALTERLKPEWQRMVEGWKDATKVMRDTYDDAMNGILRDGEDAFVKLMRTGKLDLKSLAGNLADTMWRGVFRQYFGGDVQSGAAKMLGAFGITRPGAGGQFKSGMPDGWDEEFGRLIGITDKQADAADVATRAVQVFGKGLDSVSTGLSNAVGAVTTFIASLSGGSSGGGGGGGLLGNLWDMFGSLFGGGGGSGITSGNKGLVDYGLGGGRAYGGPVRAGMDYLVGENGPERLRMFHTGGGHVMPLSAGGAGGQTVHNHYYQAGVSPAQMQAYGEAIEAKVTNRIYQDLARPGRPLYRAVRA